MVALQYTETKILLKVSEANMLGLSAYRLQTDRTGKLQCKRLRQKTLIPCVRN